MQELARLIKDENGVAEVEVGERKECGGCKACIFGNKGKHFLKAENSIGAKIGDDVLIDLQITAKKTLFASVVTMLLPMLFLSLGIVIGYLSGLPDIVSFAFGVLGLFIGLAVSYTIDRMCNKKGTFLAKIVCVVETDADTAGENLTVQTAE